MVKTPSSQILQAGQKAPDFSLKGVDGKKHSLQNFNAKALLIVFMCNHCPYVHARLGDISATGKLQGQFAGCWHKQQRLIK